MTAPPGTGVARSQSPSREPGDAQWPAGNPARCYTGTAGIRIKITKQLAGGFNYAGLRTRDINLDSGGLPRLASRRGRLWHHHICLVRSPVLSVFGAAPGKSTCSAPLLRQYAGLISEQGSLSLSVSGCAFSTFASNKSNSWSDIPMMVLKRLAFPDSLAYDSM